MTYLQKTYVFIEYVDAFIDEKYFYLAMERADIDLHHLMKQSGPFDEHKTRAIAFNLFKAVAYLHSENVAHRDLKPANIVFCHDDLTTPKLIDFGDAAFIEHDASYNELSALPPNHSILCRMSQFRLILKMECHTTVHFESAQ